MRYAKLIDGSISYAPNPIKHNGSWYGNPPSSVYEAEGYKPVVYTDPPETEPGYISVYGWDDDGESLRQIWTVVEEPDEADVYTLLNGKVAVSQGTTNAGKFLIVGSDGNVTPVAMSAWQGGSY